MNITLATAILLFVGSGIVLIVSTAIVSFLGWKQTEKDVDALLAQLQSEENFVKCSVIYSDIYLPDGCPGVKVAPERCNGCPALERFWK